jgi:hypothetical protein
VAIEFGCPVCRRLLLVEDDLAGMRLRCPGCLQPVEVPRPLPVAAAPELPPAGEGRPQERRCPFCAEPIRPEARKCRHCYEFLDRDLAVAKAREEEERIKRVVALEEKESRLARLSLICSVIGMTCPLVFAGSIAGILMGIAAHRQIRENPRLKGMGMARTGLVIGVVGLLTWPAIFFFALAPGLVKNL